jgi:hypothetical protein
MKNAVEALAQRNYEASMSSPWESATSEVRKDWLEEAQEQCQIVCDAA